MVSTAFCQPPPQPPSRADVEKATRDIDNLGREAEKMQATITKRPEGAIKEEMPVVTVTKEGEAFFLKEIKLAGCESFYPEDFDNLVQNYINKEITFSELDALAEEIAREYLKKGIIAAVFVPPQDITGESVTLQIIEARMGNLIIQDHKYFKNDMIKYYWRTKSGEIVRYDKISRNIQIMNKNPDREVRAALRAGTTPGTTDIILTPATSFPIHGSASFDKEGGASTGVSRKSIGGRHNNLLGMDDTFISGYTWGRNFMGLYVYHSVPISPNGASVLYGWSFSESKPKKDFADFGIDTKADSKTVTFHQDLFRKDEYAGEVFFGFDAKDKLVKSNTGLLNRDKLRIFKTGTSFTKRGFGSNTAFSSEYTQGMGAFSANSRGDQMMSRAAPAIFTKLNFNMSHKSILYLGIQESLRLSGQATFMKLTPQEQMGMGGIDSVRGNSGVSVDNGLIVNGELLLPSIYIPKDWRLPYSETSMREMVTSVVFTDYGYGKIRTESKSHNLMGIGAGIRISLYNQALIRMEWGFPIADLPIDTTTRETRFHFSVDIQEKLPEELYRIWKLMEEDNIKTLAWELVNKELARPDSPIRRRICEDIYLAQSYYKKGMLKESKQVYADIEKMSKSLYAQSEEYVRTCFSQAKSAREESESALLEYKKGNLMEARGIWQKVTESAKPRPLILRY